MRCLRPLFFLLLAVAVAVPARAQGTRIKDLPLTTTIPIDGRIALDASTFPALRGVSIAQLATNFAAAATASKLDATNGVAVGLTTATVPTTGNAVVNKTALDAAAALALAKASNLSDLASAATARTNLGLGTLATQSGTFSGTSSGVNTGDQTTITGNSGTATALQTARAINGVSFDGTSAITVPAAAGTLTGSTLASGVTGSSLVSAAGGAFGTSAYTAASAYDVAGAAVAATNGIASTFYDFVSPWARARYYGLTDLNTFGDSHTDSGAISYAIQLADTNGLTLHNYGVGGSGLVYPHIGNGVPKSLGNQVGHYMDPTTWSGVATMLSGYNDAYVQYSSDAWSTGYRLAYQSAIARLLVTNYVNLSNGRTATGATNSTLSTTGTTLVSSVTATLNPFPWGTPASDPRNTLLLQSGQRLSIDQSAAANVLFFELTTDGGGALIYVGGTNVARIDTRLPTPATTNRLAAAIVIPQSGYTLTITNTSGTNYLMALGQLPAASSVTNRVVIVGAPMQLTTTHSRTVSETLGQAAYGAAVEFSDFPVYFADPSKLMDPVSDIIGSADPDHFILSGQRKIAQAFQTAQRIVQPASKGTYVGSYGETMTLNGTAGGVVSMSLGRLDTNRVVMRLSTTGTGVYGAGDLEVGMYGADGSSLGTALTIAQDGLGARFLSSVTAGAGGAFSGVVGAPATDFISLQTSGGTAYLQARNANSIASIPLSVYANGIYWGNAGAQTGASFTSPALTTPTLGVATATSVAASGILSAGAGLTVVGTAAVAPASDFISLQTAGGTAYLQARNAGSVASIPLSVYASGISWLNAGSQSSATFIAPVLGAATATSLVASAGVTGSTITGTSGITVGNGSGNPLTTYNGGTSSIRGQDYLTAGSYRWRVATQGAESGSNAGADIRFDGYSDAGTFLASPFALERAGNVYLRAPAAGTAATYFPVYTGDPSSAYKQVVSRTAAEVRADIGAGTGSGTVTSASVTTANGVSATVATATNTPAFTFTLGAITPSSVVASGAITAGTGLTVGTGSGNPLISINGGTSSIRGFDYFSNSSLRWRMATQATESGSNAGADLRWDGYADDGTTRLSSPFALERAGNVYLRAPAAGSAATYFPVYTGDPSSVYKQVVSRTAAQVRSDIGAGTGSGTVTSVAMTVPSGLSVSGSPVTTTGTLAITTTLNGHVSGNGSGLTASATIPSTDISVTENTQTGTTYTVLSTDNGKVVTLNNAGAITVTVPTLSAGFSCTFIQKGAGQVTFSASGTTVSNAHSQTKTFGQYAAVTLYGLSSTAFVLAGDTGT